ncbi:MULTISPECIES: LD-carboxypeptidase [unclassified Virgibacillus]|uniref:S66 peptidase family protein n=1 Tax=unclassified Virgibacillus TaxID=2620237 RepID=UPI0024DEADED|nr:LD-carboxypeptidase [Virgibacillus sp. LDC-1]
MIYPDRLQVGDTIGVLAPASPPNMEKLYQAIPLLEKKGLKVKLGNYVSTVYGYLAGTDEERLDDLNTMIADKTIKAIFFARGGYGTGRIADRIDYALLRDNPKIIWGYSDITYLHTAIHKQAELVTFHGPMIESDIAKPDFDSKSFAMLDQLFAPMEIRYTEEISPLHVLVPGTARGQLVGGNLSLLTSTLGTSFEIDTKDKILLIEDIGEAPYRIDSMLNQLRLAGKLSKLAGVAVADFADSSPKASPSLTLEEVFDHYFQKIACPVVTGFKIGHCTPNIAIPLGVEATLDSTSKTLLITPGVQ